MAPHKHTTSELPQLSIPLPSPGPDPAAPILALTALRLLLCAAAALAFAPSLLGTGTDRGQGIAPALATLAAPVLYAALFALLLFCRPRGGPGAALLLLLGGVEGAAIGAALALLGWGWALRIVLVALVAGAGVFAGLAAAAYIAPGFRALAVAAAAVLGLLGSTTAVAVDANAPEVACAWLAVGGGALFALRDMPGVLERVGGDEAGLGAAVLGISGVLDTVDSVGREGTSRV